jgi:hypothetical protein
MAHQPRDLETLAATRGMHKKLTFEDIDYILSHQKSKAPGQTVPSRVGQL